MTTTGRKQRDNRRYTGCDFGPLETEGYLPIQPTEYDGERALSDLHVIAWSTNSEMIGFTVLLVVLSF
jgi:hypothetical protein